MLDRYDRVVLWGFTDSLDSFRHIHRHFSHALDRLGKDWIWIPDNANSLHHLAAGDMVFAVDVEGHHVRAVEGVDYVLHNMDSSHPVWDGIGHFIRLQTYTIDCEQWGVEWAPGRRFDKEARTLFQPWGTDLLADEFLPPVYNTSNHVVFVGSVWDGNGQGNVRAIGELKRVLDQKRLVFQHLYHIGDQENIAVVRDARLAPAVAGEWQVEHNYLPCRYFKNVSYGALGITNVPKIRDLVGEAFFEGHSVQSLIENALDLPENVYLELVEGQQEAVSKYTYRESLEAIDRALEETR